MNPVKLICLSFVSVIFVVISCKRVGYSKENIIKRGDAIIYLKINNPNNSFIKLQSYGVDKFIYLDENNSFIDTLKNINLGYYVFSDKRHSSGFYIRPNDSISINIDTEDFVKKVIYGGDNTIENTYLTQSFLLKRLLSQVNSVQHLAFLDEQFFLRTIDSIKNLKEDLLNRFDNKNNLDRHFKFLEQNRILFDYINSKETYEDYRKYALEDEKFKVAKIFYDYKKELDLENYKLIVIPSYHYFLSNHYQKMANVMTMKDSSDVYINYLKVIGKNVKNSVIKERLLYSYANQNMIDVIEKDDFLKLFKQLSNNDEHKSTIKNLYHKFRELAPGKKSPDFSLYNKYGELISIKDFKNNYIYMIINYFKDKSLIKQKIELDKLKKQS